MKRIAANYFKAHCLAIVDYVHDNRHAVVITKRGRPMAKLIPLKLETGEIYNFFEGKGSIAGDILSPVLPQKNSD